MKKQEEKITFRMAVEKDWEPAMKLAWETFLVFEAQEYSDEGIEICEFYGITPEQLYKMNFPQITIAKL